MSTKNLIPASQRSPEQVRELGRMGGIKSGQAKREKKLLSTLYGEMLAEKFSLEIEGAIQELEGKAFFKHIVQSILARCDSASVALLKEIRETTEGNQAMSYEVLEKLDGYLSNIENIA